MKNKLEFLRLKYFAQSAHKQFSILTPLSAVKSIMRKYSPAKSVNTGSKVIPIANLIPSAARVRQIFTYIFMRGEFETQEMAGRWQKNYFGYYCAF